MTTSSPRSTVGRHLLLVALSLVLCGCVKFHVSVDVEEDGSGTVAASLGLTARAIAFAEDQGFGDPTDEIRSYLEREVLAGEVVEERWTEGDYSWVEYRSRFATLDELNALARGSELFESFEVREEPGPDGRRFVVDGVVSTTFLESQIPADIEIDVTQMFDLRMAVSLPGEITETNGKQSSEDPSAAWWRIQSGPPIEIHAVSDLTERRAFNWLAVGGAAAAVLTVAVVVVFGVRALAQRKRMADLPAPPTAADP
jgi:hypothetical protein